MVTKVNFPKEVLIISSAGLPVFEFIVRLIPIGVILWWYGVPLHWSILFMPLVLFPVILMALGGAFILAVSNLVVRDIANMLGIILGVTVFLTPVFYPPPESYPFFLINILNPLSPLVIATQDLLGEGRIADSGIFSAACLFSLLLFLSGWRLFHLVMPKVAERA